VEELTRRWQLEDGEEEEPEEEKSAPEKDEEPKLLEKFLKTRTILISEEITSELAKRVYQNLLLLEADDAEKPITVVINSPGGEADSGFGIYDMMRFVRPPVRTIVAGLCASAAILIFLAAKKGERLSLPHSRYLLHQPSSASFGQASDLEIAANEIIRLRDRYNEIVSEATGKPADTVAQDADRDFWMAAPQAVGYGLVDRVITRRDEI
jgi:ATP-dependent Clp protease protease subunit